MYTRTELGPILYIIASYSYITRANTMAYRGKPALSDKRIMVERLKEALKKRFPGEDVNLIAEILFTASKTGRITYDEPEIHDEEKDDLFILLEKERLLIPSRTSRSLAWEDRMMVLRPGEVFEVPNAILHLIRCAKETGEWKPYHAIKAYLEEIGEKSPVVILSMFKKIRGEAKGLIVTPKELLKAAERLKLTSEIGRIIAELKGGGIISPCLRDPSHLLYEINPSLIEKHATARDRECSQSSH
jgi:hypothetical protein